MWPYFSDLNGRVGKEPNYIVQDKMNGEFTNSIDNLRVIEDVKMTNTFGKRNIDLCLASGLRICNGRFVDNSGHYTSSNQEQLWRYRLQIKSM